MEQLVQLFQWTVEVIHKLGYPGVFALMTLESTFVPIPSELVMPQAGYLVAQGHMNFWIALLMATLGSVLGALINYGIAVKMGRPLMLKYGKYFLCPPHKFEKMEKFFVSHGEISTFTGRLILGVRHFISFPAGLARMHLWKFCFYTAFGAGLWAAVLEAIGYVVGDKPELIKKYAHQAGAIAFVTCVVIVTVYVIVHRRRKAAAATPAE
ncbi:MAG: DedA family protein [Verrucomicrobia bacterium]|nr:MAG: DedA family protein [Verrucomicrobiota bacterium]